MPRKFEKTVLTVKPREERVVAGVLVMALAVVFFTCIDTSAKWLSQSGLPILVIVFFRYAGHFIFSLLIYLPKEGIRAFHSNSPIKQFLRAAFLASSTILNFIALTYLPITLTTTIAFAGPIVVTMLAIPILGEKVGIRRITAVCVGFFGVLVVVRPWGIEFNPALIYSFGMLLMASMYFIMTRMLAGVETASVMQLWSSGLPTIVLLPFVLNLFTWPETLMQGVVLVAIGVFGAFGHIAAVIAHRWADASILSPLIYTQIYLAAIAGVLVFDTWPTIWTFLGGLIIIGSGLYIWQRERYKAKQNA